MVVRDNHMYCHPERPRTKPLCSCAAAPEFSSGRKSPLRNSRVSTSGGTNVVPSRAATAFISPARLCWDVEIGKVESASAGGTDCVSTSPPPLPVSRYLISNDPSYAYPSDAGTCCCFVSIPHFCCSPSPVPLRCGTPHRARAEAFPHRAESASSDRRDWRPRSGYSRDGQSRCLGRRCLQGSRRGHCTHRRVQAAGVLGRGRDRSSRLRDRNLARSPHGDRSAG